ncbi:MAG TPA: hypothetical protein VGS22_10050 [Thermoanaerobaculia bacterium]|nr:hypothetical protein [Thermoanaerobaculia bacterium]
MSTEDQDQDADGGWNPGEETRRATRLLETLTHMQGLTRGELDDLLGAGRSYSSQLFGHRFSPKYERILDVLRALDIEPGFFFRVLYPDPSDRPRPTSMFERFLSRLHPSAEPAAANPAPPPAAKPARLDLTEESLERKIRATLEKMLFERGQNAPARPAKSAAKRED